MEAPFHEGEEKEIYKLNELHPDFQGLGKTDSRLTETSESCARGCGGVGILWKRSLDVTPISEIQSDRICGVRIKSMANTNESWISIIGVYLPCLDLGVDLYRESLIELERLILDSERMGPVIVTGDFNAHLGPMWGPRAQEHPNFQGILLVKFWIGVNFMLCHLVSLYLALATRTSREVHQPL